MRRAFTNYTFRAFVSQGAQVQVIPQVLTRSEQDRTHRQMHLVDQASLQVLPNGGDTAPDAYVTPVRSSIPLSPPGSPCI